MSDSRSEIPEGLLAAREWMEKQLFFENFEDFVRAKRQPHDSREGRFGRENIAGVGIGWKNWPQQFAMSSGALKALIEEIGRPYPERPFLFERYLDSLVAADERACGRWCVRVLVNQKVAEKRVDPEVLVSEVMKRYRHDFLTDVVEVGRISPAANTSIYRPVTCGVSGGHVTNAGGTLGTVVKRKADGKRLLLSCNHVVANSNAAQRGDPIIQPSLKDSGSLNNKIGVLEGFAPLDFTGQINYVDAAVVEPLVQVDPSMEGTRIVPFSAVTPQMGQEVIKVGRTTGFTRGVVTSVNLGLQGVRWDIPYDGRFARFADIFAVHHSYPPFSPMPTSTASVAFALPGDSGSLIFENATHHAAVGLLLHVSENLMEAYACSFSRIETALGVEVA